MLDKNLDEITEADLQTLAAIQAPESFRLEFKRQINLATNSEKKELAKDVSAMANMSGGRIVYGMEEITLADGSKAAGPIAPLTDGTVQAAMENIIATTIHPRPRLRMRRIDVTGGFVLIVDVYPSYDRDLHMVTGYGDERFYRRGEQSTQRMTEPEIREAYTRIAVAMQALNSAIDQAVARELSHSQRLNESVLVIPLFGHRRLVQPQQFGAQFGHQLANGAVNFSQWHRQIFALRIQSDGYRAWFPEDGELSAARSYAAVLRNGTVHLADELDEDQQTHDLQLAVMPTVDTLITAMTIAKEVFSRAGYWGPIRVLHCLRCPKPTAVDCLVGDRRHFPGNKRGIIPVGDYRHEVPEIDWPELATSFKPVVQQIFEQIFQSAGEAACHWFDAAGNWTQAAPRSIQPLMDYMR